MPTVEAAKITIPVITNADNTTRKLKRLDKQLDNTNQLSKEQSKILKNANQDAKRFGRTVGIVVVAGIAAFVCALRKGVKASSALEEATSKFDTVFGKLAKGMNKDVQDLTKNYAMSTRETKQYLSSIQDLLVPMGVNATLASKMSGAVVRLSADLGSFNDQPTAQVMMDIQSALVGNFETMKKYGVVLNETAVQQEALKLGLISHKSEIDQASKAQAAYSLIIKGTTAAQGDMIRTAKSYANAQKRMNAVIEDFNAEFGTKAKKGITNVFNALTLVLSKDQPMRDMLVNIGRIGSSLFTSLANGIMWLNVQIGRMTSIALKPMRNIAMSEQALIDKADKLKKSNPFDGYTKTLQNYRAATLQANKAILQHLEITNKGFTSSGEAVNGYVTVATEGYGKIIVLAKDYNRIVGGGTKKIFDFAAVLGNLQKSQNKGLSGKGGDGTISLQKELDAIVAFNKLKLDAQKTYFDNVVELAQTAADTLLTIGQSITDAVFANQQFQIDAMQRRHDTAIRNDQREQQISKATTDVEKNRLRDQFAFEDKIEKKRRRLARNQAIANKAFGLFDVGIKTAMGITRAFADYMFPFSAAIATLVGVAGAAQAGAIASMPIPAAAFGGSFSVPPGNQGDSGLVKVNSGEQVDVTPVADSGGGGMSQNVTLMVDDRPMRAWVIDTVNDGFENGKIQIRRKGAVKLA